MDTFMGFVVLGLIIYWLMRRRKTKAASAPRAVSATPKSSGSEDDELKAGRGRLPGKNWVCTRCGRGFMLKVDPKSVPRMWWIGPNNQWKSGETAPWACPDCGTYAYTVPRG